MPTRMVTTKRSLSRSGSWTARSARRTVLPTGGQVATVLARRTRMRGVRSEARFPLLCPDSSGMLDEVWCRTGLIELPSITCLRIPVDASTGRPAGSTPRVPPRSAACGPSASRGPADQGRGPVVGRLSRWLDSRRIRRPRSQTVPATPSRAPMSSRSHPLSAGRRTAQNGHGRPSLDRLWRRWRANLEIDPVGTSPESFDIGRIDVCHGVPRPSRCSWASRTRRKGATGPSWV